VNDILIVAGVVSGIGGVIAQGKEATVHHARNGDMGEGTCLMFWSHI